LKKTLILFTFIVSALAISSYASSVSVASVSQQTHAGQLTYIYFETASGPSTTTPSTNTALSPSGSSANYQISKGSSGYLWSTKFTSAATISAGNWELVLYASCTAAETIKISFETTTSTGTVQSIMVNNIATKTISTSKTEIVTSFVGSSGTVPANGYVVAVLSAPSPGARHCVIYWGSGQQTDLQTPYRVLTS